MQIIKLKKTNNRMYIYLFKRRIFSIKYNCMEIDKRFKNSCDIPKIKELLENGNVFDHPVGIVISEFANIGSNNRIYQNVTIGTHSFAGYINREYPTIGNNNVLCAGSIILGNIKIGNNCIIAASSIVVKDVPNNTLVIGSPPNQQYKTIPDNYFYDQRKY